MRVLLDACVLYPTVMREVLIGAADQGFYQPFWSERILEEWALAARKLGPEGEVIARGEIAALQAAWPVASVRVPEGRLTRLWLPDAGDIHVLGAAIECSADLIVTMNAKDFPRNILAEEGLSRVDPDGLLFGFFQANPDHMQAVADGVLAKAVRISGRPLEMRKLMKKAKLPRFAKAVSGAV